MTSRNNSLAVALTALLLVSAAAGTALSGCASSVPRWDYNKEPDPRKQEFILGPTDVLQINVWKNPDLSTDAVIRPDGTITMPLLGDIQAAGRTPTALKNDITERLTAYVKDAVVSVSVTGVNSYKFTVTGNVERAGTYQAGTYLTVLEAMALAGGPNRFASPDQLFVIRRDLATGRIRKIPINYDLLSRGEHLQQNIVVMPGDTLQMR